jgi:hypothetical protein
MPLRTRKRLDAQKVVVWPTGSVLGLFMGFLALGWAFERVGVLGNRAQLIDNGVRRDSR